MKGRFVGGHCPPARAASERQHFKLLIRKAPFRSRQESVIHWFNSSRSAKRALFGRSAWQGAILKLANQR
jgi:hypothetical protein